jgi:DNA invertase Pin-like site-specific DNA recombinase
MITAIYIRTSTQEQNPQNQLKGCLELNTFGEYHLFSDKQSAWKEYKERDGFNEVKKLIKGRSIKHLIVWDLDRIYRNRKNLIEFFKYCNIYGVKIHSYRQQWLNDLNNIQAPFNEIMHDMMLQIMGWLSEEESQKKSDRVKSAVRRVEGKPTRSYLGKKWGRKAVHTNKKAVVLEYYKQGMSYRQIRDKAGLSLGKISEIVKEGIRNDN